MATKKTSDGQFDALIIGGGINGAGIAREATKAGYKILVCDAGDFGGGTSSASTKLIHGGLRYLEHYKFGLVRDALREREKLWKMAPHIIRPMRFVLPHHKGLRPAWLLRLGLFIYDHIGGRKLLPKTEKISRKNDEAFDLLKPQFVTAFEYSDCWVDDARLVILNLKDASKMGADVRSRARVKNAKWMNDQWEVTIEQEAGTQIITAKIIINAGGPWVDEILRTVFGLNQSKNVRLVRGSHIVINQKFRHDRAYIFQNHDERVVFAIPYEDEFTLIGTTDVEQDQIAVKPEITQEEIQYLCETASEYFEEPVTQDDVVWTFSGVRPLYDDGASKAQEATREYVIKVEEAVGDGNLINIFGGKITTFAKLARVIVPKLQKRIANRKPLTEVDEFYSGGGLGVDELPKLQTGLIQKFSFVSQKIIGRMVRQYGTETKKILKGAESTDQLGTHFGAGLYEIEVDYLVKNEWARTAEDIVWRRTKLGLKMSEEEIKNLQKFLDTQKGGRSG